MLEKLKPSDCWKHFEELTRIPRCSKNEKKAADYVKTVADRAGLKWKQDKAGNVVVYKPGTKGHEKAPATVLQGHLDMVCEKNENVKHDFRKDPLKLKIVDGSVFASGTTLGADNGIGVAMGLALMEAKNVTHGPLEFLFTIDEETGLTGAQELDTRLLKGKRLINLDTEEDDALYVGCAGGKDTVIKLMIAREKQKIRGTDYIRISVKGLKGGHSGLNIHEQRGNANIVMTRLLTELYLKFQARIVTMDGGSKRNAISREAFAVTAVPAKELASIKKTIKEYEKIYQGELSGAGEKLKIIVEENVNAPYPPLTKNSNEKALHLMLGMPHGVLAMSLEIPGLVETSTNFPIVETTKGMVRIDTSQRSSVETQKDNAARVVGAVGRLAGASVSHPSEYPGWQPRMDSAILKTCKGIYKTMFKKDPRIEAIHAGLECGIIGEKCRGMDMVSLGPTIHNVHSPDESVEIKSVEKSWKYLLAILEKLA